MSVRVFGEDLRSFLLNESHGGHGDRLSADLDADFRGVQDVLVPRRGGSPSRRDHETATGGVMGDDFQDGLTSLAGDAAGVIEQHQAMAEQPTQADPIEVDRHSKQKAAQPSRGFRGLDDSHDSDATPIMCRMHELRLAYCVKRM